MLVDISNVEGQGVFLLLCDDYFIVTISSSHLGCRAGPRYRCMCTWNILTTGHQLHDLSQTDYDSPVCIWRQNRGCTLTSLSLTVVALINRFGRHCIMRRYPDCWVGRVERWREMETLRKKWRWMERIYRKIEEDLATSIRVRRTLWTLWCMYGLSRELIFLAFAMAVFNRLRNKSAIRNILTKPQ